MAPNFSNQEKGKFPAQPLANPQGQTMMVEEGTSQSTLEHVKSITLQETGDMATFLKCRDK